MNGILEIQMLEDVRNANHIILTGKKCIKCLNEKSITVRLSVLFGERST